MEETAQSSDLDLTLTVSAEVDDVVPPCESVEASEEEGEVNRHKPQHLVHTLVWGQTQAHLSTVTTSLLRHLVTRTASLQ